MTQKPLKITIVSLGLAAYFDPGGGSFGGAEAQAAFVADALSRVGCDVTLVVANLSPEQPLPFRSVNAFDTSQGIRGLRFFYPRLNGILTALDTADADVYYQRNAGMVTGVTAMFCRRHRKVFVYGAGSDTDLTFGSARVDGMRDRVMFYAGLKLASGIVAQNRYQEALCQRHHRSKPVKVISNGVAVATLDANRPRDVVLWIGAIRRVKQPELFVELARRLPSQKFVLIGAPSSTERVFARNIEEAAESVSNLTLTGHLPHNETLAYLERAAALVNTSSVEGFPNAYLEAWSRRVPVVAFADIDGLLEGEGMGVVCKSMEEMERATLAIASDESRRREMGERAVAVVERRFSPHALAGRYVDFFRELLARQG